VNKVTAAKPLVLNVLTGVFVLGGLWMTYSDAPAPSSMSSAAAAPWEQPAARAHRFPVKDVSLDEARALIAAGAIVIDVRDKAVSGSAHLPGALLIPLEVLEARLKTMEVAKTQPIVVYCGKGSTLGPEAAHILTQAGYSEVVNLAPGLSGWRDAGLPVQSS
jgi:rhodanese-related sulfurtransferase